MYITKIWCNGFYCRKWTPQPEFKILDKTVCISHCTNTLAKIMQSTTLPLTIGKY